MDTWEGYGIVPQVLSKRSCRRRFRCCSFLFRRSSDGDRHQENELQKPCFSTSHGTDSHLKITGRPRICWSSWTRRAGESKFDVGFGEIETLQHCSWFVGSCTRRGPPTSILAARRLSGIHLWSTSTLQGHFLYWERKEVRRRREWKRKRYRKALAGRQPEKYFLILSDLNQAVPNHLADESQTR